MMVTCASTGSSLILLDRRSPHHPRPWTLVIGAHLLDVLILILVVDPRRPGLRRRRPGRL